MSDLEMLKTIIRILDDKMAEDITAFRINEVSSLADYILICTSNSEVHGRSLADYVTEELKKEGVRFLAVEGKDTSKWICIDYGEIILHIMTGSEREFYHLESIWGACDKITPEMLEIN